MRFAFNIYIYIMRILPHVQTVKLYILYAFFPLKFARLFPGYQTVTVRIFIPVSATKNIPVSATKKCFI